MKAYIVRQTDDSSFSDTVLRAPSEEEAEKLLREGEELTEIRDDVAKAMGVGEQAGRHDGALWKWFSSDTNILGEVKKSA